jgi:MYXO-CTERM domain-containing protein
VAIVGSPVGGRPPCFGTGPCAGRCDGKNSTACTFPAGETSCAAPSCSGNVATEAAVCSGKGNCSPPATHTCASGCFGNACGPSDDGGLGGLATSGGCRAGGNHARGRDGTALALMLLGLLGILLRRRN